ncbi:hypothetical protein LDENG_00034060 [Lucifuga dentata]|nr:hypothetical protein LDENG_00034060 [Lucifuga dentata]
MNTSLKHWKEAATLILAAGYRLGADGLSRTPQKSAPLLPAGSSCEQDNLPHKSAFDYDVLLLKRSEKSGFMPNTSVFPGGKLDSSDFSNEWMDIFKAFRGSPNFGLGLVKQPAETRPPIFATDRLKFGSPVPGEVALRICALRETFEECGVFVCVSKMEENSLLKSIKDRRASGHTLHTHVPKLNELGSCELKKWRALVNKNPYNFIRMCRELEVLPNIWALHEWTNWLSPTSLKSKRFDTAFFMCCLEEIPHTLHDQREVVQFQWSTPSEILHSFQAKELLLAPPQFYELRRMCRFPLLNDLHSFACQRATEGCERWLPVHVYKDNQRIALMPGDELYLESSSGKSEVNMSTNPHSESPQAESALHRILFFDPYTLILQINITPKYNHVVPVVGLAMPHVPNSQL